MSIFPTRNESGHGFHQHRREKSQAGLPRITFQKCTMKLKRLLPITRPQAAEGETSVTKGRKTGAKLHHIVAQTLSNE